VSFARLGVRGLVVADIDLDAAKATVVECQSVALHQNLRLEAVGIDVSLEDSVNRVVRQVADTLGRIDYCVHAAGVRAQHNHHSLSRITDSLKVGVKVASPVAEADTMEFDRMLKVNVTGTFLVTRAISAVMKSQEPTALTPGSPERGTTRGSIVIIGSASAFVATPGMIQYTTAKHAALGITKNAGE